MNTDARNKYLRAWAKSPSGMESLRKKNRKYYAANREKINSYINGWMQKRRKEDPRYLLTTKLRNAYNRALRYYADTRKYSQSKYFQYLGCSVEEWIDYISSIYPDWTEKYGTELEIDHAFPLSAGKEWDLKRWLTLWHHSNIRLLPPSTNRQRPRYYPDAA